MHVGLYDRPTSGLAQSADYGVFDLRVTTRKRDVFPLAVWGTLIANSDELVPAKMIRRGREMAGAAANHVPNAATLRHICKGGTRLIVLVVTFHQCMPCFTPVVQLYETEDSHTVA